MREPDVAAALKELQSRADRIEANQDVHPRQLAFVRFANEGGTGYQPEALRRNHGLVARVT